LDFYRIVPAGAVGGLGPAHDAILRADDMAVSKEVEGTQIQKLRNHQTVDASFLFRVASIKVNRSKQSIKAFVFTLGVGKFID